MFNFFKYFLLLLIIGFVFSCNKTVPKKKANLSNARQIKIDNILFAYKSTRIINDNGAIDKVASAVTRYETQGLIYSVYVIGHTDTRGTVEGNQTLSQKRADKVTSLLVQKGVSRSRITAIGKGESEPIASDNLDVVDSTTGSLFSTAEKVHAKNRRVVFKISVKGN